MSAPSTKLEGVHYVSDHLKRTTTGKPTRRKPTLDELRRRNGLLHETQRASDEIRQRANLEPLAPNFYRQAMAAELEARKASESKRQPKRTRRATPAPKQTIKRTRGRVPAPTIELTPALAFRMTGAELKALARGNDPSEVAMREIQRRRDKRAAKVLA